MSNDPFYNLLSKQPSEQHWYTALRDSTTENIQKPVRDAYLYLITINDYWTALRDGQPTFTHRTWMDFLYLTQLLMNPLHPSSFKRIPPDFIELSWRVRLYYQSDNLPFSIVDLYTRINNDEDETQFISDMSDLATLIRMVYFHACYNQHLIEQALQKEDHQ